MHGPRIDGSRSQNIGDVLVSHNFKTTTRTKDISSILEGSSYTLTLWQPSNIFVKYLFYDRCLNWSGICVEENDHYFEPIYLERSCSLVPICVSKNEGDVVEFNRNGLFGGIINESYKYFSSDRVKTSPRRLRCTTIAELCKRFSIHVIDYLSLDVEGHKLNVLQGVDWERTTVSVLSVQINGAGFNNISSYVPDRGCKQHEVKPTAVELSKYKNFVTTDAINSECANTGI